MTVAELIKELEKVEDKTKEVAVYIDIDEADVYKVQEYPGGVVIEGES